MTFNVKEWKLSARGTRYEARIDDMSEEEFKEFFEYIAKKYRLVKAEEVKKNDN